jgi:hypothetical protein
MKTHKIKYRNLFSVVFFLLIMNVSCSIGQENYGIDSDMASKISDRLSITFILGEDREYDNPYYIEAANYYKYNEEGKTEYVNTGCRSLLEVRDYLLENPPANGKPWGCINLVSHGNQWLGLSVRVTPESKRATPERIWEYIDNGTFSPMPLSVIDELSEFYIHGCGVGKNTELLDAITEAFRNNDTVPVVKASRLFEYYSSVKYKGSVIETQKYEARAWSVNYKMGYRPSYYTLMKWLDVKYPDESINWQDALNREQPRWDGDSYHYTFEVPVKWVIKYPNRDSLPDVSTNSKKLEWIAGQQEIMNDLQQIEIEPEKFNWWFRTVNVRNDDGSLSPAVWVKGYCTILCVIQPVVENNDFLSQK